VTALADSGHTLFLELGPHPVLSRPVEQCLRHQGLSGRVLASARRDEDAHVTLAKAARVLHAEGLGAKPGSRATRSSSEEGGAPQVLLLSGRSAEALQAQAQRYGGHLAAHPEQTVREVCFTASAGRAHFEHRAAILGSTARELRERLAHLAQGNVLPEVLQGRASGEAPRVAFLFTGQGSQYAGMGRGLYEAWPVFREALDRCDAILEPHLGRSLLPVLFSGEALLSQTEWTQPALVSLELALAALLRSWGVRPAAVLGHSVGELAAACVAGVLSEEQVLPLAALRGRLMQALPEGGAMVAVRGDPARLLAEAAAFDKVAAAAFNSPEDTVLSGEAGQLRELLDRLQVPAERTRWLRTSHAFHSPLMEPMLDAFEQALAGLKLGRPEVPLFANVTGARAGEEITTAAYWRRHVREPVRFAQGLGALMEAGVDAIVELGPHPTLIPLGMAAQPGAQVAWLHALRRGRDEAREVLAAAARLHLLGVELRWEEFHAGTPRRRVPLPGYAFQRQRFWLEGATAPAAEDSDSQVLRLLRTGDIAGLARVLEREGVAAQAKEQLPAVLAALVRAHGRGSSPPPSLLYRLAWRLTERPRRLPLAPGGTWVVLAGTGGVGEQLAEGLRAQGQRCLQVVRAGARSRVGEAGVIEVDPLRPGDFDRVVEEAGPTLRGVVYLWGLEAPPALELTAAALERSCDAVCGGALHLVQALARVASCSGTLYLELIFKSQALDLMFEDGLCQWRSANISKAYKHYSNRIHLKPEKITINLFGITS
jgi:acyl transferase domain-containing protein